MRFGGTRRWLLVVFPLAFFMTLIAWALTSPVGSSPDDDYHLSSIWCAGGERAGVCEMDPSDPSVRLLPESVAYAHECFASDGRVTAACSESLTNELVITERVNDIQGLYPTGFYRTLGLFVGPDQQRSVLVMRLFNAAVAAAFLLLAVRVLVPAIRSAVVVVFVVVLVPLGLFLLPSTNPSSWTITGITFLWAFGLALAQRTNWRSRRTWIIAAATVLAAVMAITSRVDAAAYVVVTVAVVFALTGWRRLRRSGTSAAVLGVLAVAGAVQFVTFGPPGSGIAGGMGGTTPGPGLLLTNIVYLPVYLSGAVGGMSLGWNDTFLPPLVFVFGVLALGALTYRGLVKMPPRKAVAAGLALAALVLVPLTFLQREGLGVGEVVQARYLLPLIIVLFAVLSVRLPLRGRRASGLELPSAAAWALGIGMAASGSLSLWVHAHRYASGAERGLFDIDLVLEWTGITALPLPLVVLVGVFATGGYICAGVALIKRDGELIRR